MPEEVVFLEFSDEADAYLSWQASCGPTSRPSTVIALNPSTRLHLKRRGIEAENTLPYLTPASRERALEASMRLTRWVREHFAFEDNRGLSIGYLETLVWYMRSLIHQFLWSVEILENAVSKHSPEVLKTGLVDKGSFSDSMTGDGDWYLGIFGMVSERFALGRGIEFDPVRIYGSRAQGGTVRRLSQRAFLKLARNRLAAGLHLRRLRRMAKSSPLLFTSKDYRMNVLAGRLRREVGLPALLWSGWGYSRRAGWPITTRGVAPFTGEARLSLLEPLADEDKSSLRRLEATLDALSTAADSSADLSHLGVPFGDLAAQKLRLGIAPVIQGLHHRAAASRLVLENLRPSAVFSDGSHLDDALTGELCGTMDIPAVMVSHGSHPPPSSEAEYYELGEHALHMINAPYSFTALQSPVAEEFRKVFPTESTGLRTGPLIWAAQPDKERSTTLRRRLFGASDQDKVIVHAGTPKRKRGLRFHGYETFDEYLQSLQDLVAAVEQVPNTRLIVKFRPFPELSVDDLRALVDFSEKVLLSVQEPLVDVLGFTDLLISFSSTVIEEALQNRIPVLLYGGEGRYQHVRATTIGSGDSPDPSAVFHVKEAGELSYALRYMLNTCGPHQLCDEHFAPYVYPAEQVVALDDLITMMSGRAEAQAGKAA